MNSLQCNFNQCGSETTSPPHWPSTLVYLKVALLPALPSLHHGSVSKHSCNIIYKFADNTTVTDWITGGDESGSRRGKEHLVEWCCNSYVLFNVNKNQRPNQWLQKEDVGRSQWSEVQWWFHDAFIVTCANTQLNHIPYIQSSKVLLHSRTILIRKLYRNSPLIPHARCQCLA